MTGEEERRKHNWFFRSLLVLCLFLAIGNALFGWYRHREPNLLGQAGPWVFVGLVAAATFWLWRKL